MNFTCEFIVVVTTNELQTDDADVGQNLNDFYETIFLFAGLPTKYLSFVGITSCLCSDILP